MGAHKPLRIVVHGDLFYLPFVEELQKEGHLVYRLNAMHCETETGTVPVMEENCDLILGPNCARFLPGMEKFLDSFLKGARVLKYGKVKK